MTSPISESDTDTKDKKLEGRARKGKTLRQETLVSVGSNRTTLTVIPVTEVPSTYGLQWYSTAFNYK
jgi:hypothetical protein